MLRLTIAIAGAIMLIQGLITDTIPNGAIGIVLLACCLCPFKHK